MIKEGAKANPVLSSLVGGNAKLFAEVIRMYATDGMTVADVTYGKGIFWKHVDVSRFNCLFTDIQTGVDFTDLPYDDKSIDMLVLDPPYMHTPGTVKQSISKGYRVNELQASGIRRNSDVLELYYSGMAEGKRVLRAGGFLVVKCQDQIESGKQNYNHISIHDYAVYELGMYAKDLFVLSIPHKPAMRYDFQHHARKNHSYFWVFEKLAS